MNDPLNIVVTGAAGFIGSCLVGYLNASGYDNLILVDDFSHVSKKPNLSGKKYIAKIERGIFFEWLERERPGIEFVYHVGARTDTTEFEYSILEHLNVEYSKKIWTYCAQNHIPLVYASSAATYGSGEHGFADSHEIIADLHPLNPYGVSKNEFDKWVLLQASFDGLRTSPLLQAQDDNRQAPCDELRTSPLLQAQNDNSLTNSKTPPAWAGLKFFNVYGPNEYHKARMASVIFHAFNQVVENGFVKLFRSHKKDFKDGEQLRDFIYVKDVLKICGWFMECFKKDPGSFKSGIYNVGTGVARTFNDLATATFNGIDRRSEIRYIDMPEDIRDTYQYYTQAAMQKIKAAGYNENMFSLEEGVDDYVRNYLSQKKYL
jgi:ADP-L-glycero-D-manno-heptose 6-epimerase